MRFFIVRRKEEGEGVSFSEELGDVVDEFDAPSLLEALSSETWERAPLGSWLVDFKSGMVRAERRHGRPELHIARRGAAA
ncbi:MAG TPA: hypothetical protein VF765_31010 [Polyangiaceae bacterium]